MELRARVPHPGAVQSTVAPPDPGPRSAQRRRRPGRWRLSPAGRWWPRGWRLPGGRELAPADFASRHRVVCVLLGLHVPLLLVLLLVRGESLAATLGHLVPVVVLLAVAVVPPSRLPLPALARLASRRRVRSGATTGGMLLCSALLVHAFDGSSQVHFHYLLAVTVVALYQDWAVFALALGFVVVQHVLGLGLDHGDRGAASTWGWTLLHAGFVLAQSAVLVVFWHANETARDEQDRMRDALVHGQGSVQARLESVQARLEETDRIRTDLIGTVSHEFRTPLTGIRGAALTLLKRGERLDDAGRARLLHAVLEQQERLSRLLENMLTAAQATATDPAAAAEVDAVAAEVAMLAGAARPECPPVSVLIDPGLAARIDRQALHQVLANLVDNAQLHGAKGAVPLLAAGRDDRGIWVTVSNEGTTLDSETARTLFDPFVQADSGPTRRHEGLGMGLYVVRRLVEVYGGEVMVRSEGGWTTVELRLQPPALAAVPDAEEARAVAV